MTKWNRRQRKAMVELLRNTRKNGIEPHPVDSIIEGRFPPPTKARMKAYMKDCPRVELGKIRRKSKKVGDKP